MSLLAEVRKQRASRRKGDLSSSDCPSRTVLEHVSSRWGILVLIVLLEGTHRFSELVRAVGGVSEKMLAQTLQHLEFDGFVLRTVFPTVPPKVEYSLTPMGQEIATHMHALGEWIQDNMPKVMQVRARNEALKELRKALPPRNRAR